MPIRAVAQATQCAVNWKTFNNRKHFYLSMIFKLRVGASISRSVRPSVCPSVRPSVPPSVRRKKCKQQIEQEQGNIQKTKVVSMYEQTPKYFSNPIPSPKIIHFGPKNPKMTPKSGYYQKSELKEIQKTIIIQLHEQN